MLEMITTHNNNVFNTKAFEKETNIKVCDCKIAVNENTDTWTISSWYTEKGFGHKGFGTNTLQACLSEINKYYKAPTKVEYIWNGANEYVLEWLNKHFGAVSKCPLVVQKYQSDDDWESHIYILNRNKFVEYFHLKQSVVV